ncbi:type 1 glutamine amidotransferase [Aquihabitans daechungensis]|uniref:type 1 glutamine amidotransferase n=1 Tax=Aquihabitans daechungensis TaxID=1052257 RepID=UPI003BA36A84
MSNNVPEDPLRIGLVQCGHIHPDLVPEHGDYPKLFGDLLGSYGIELTTFDVDHGQFPADLAAFDGWIITGSANSAYEDLPWIHQTEDLLRELITQQAPMVAVCFGHQLLAQALGGTVAKSPAGWGAGVHAYELVGEPAPWMDPPAHGTLRLIASHQDQVTELPGRRRGHRPHGPLPGRGVHPGSRRPRHPAPPRVHPRHLAGPGRTTARAHRCRGVRRRSGEPRRVARPGRARRLDGRFPSSCPSVG